VSALAPQPTDVVLDLAGGTGDMAEALSGRVAKVIETDLSPGMVEAARRRRLSNVEHRVLDMQAIDLADESVDAVVCRFGYMLVPERARAFRETRRVLKLGGRLAFATWGPAKRNPWATVFGPVLLERGLTEQPQPGEPGQFALSEPGEIEALLREAGFDDMAVEEVAVESRFESWDDYRRTMLGLSTLMRETLAQLDDGTRAEVTKAAEARLERFRTPGGYAIPGLALVTRAS
jgi:SAM-dependent methyltransferase